MKCDSNCHAENGDAEMSPIDIQAVAAALSGVGAIATGMAAFLLFKLAQKEFSHKRALEQAETFFRLANPDTVPEWYIKIRDAISTPGPCDLSCVTPTHKRLFLSRYESIAILVNSGLIPEHVAYFAFGSGVIAAYESDDLWKNVSPGREDPSWTVLRDFHKRIKYIHDQRLPGKADHPAYSRQHTSYLREHSLDDIMN